MHRDSDVGFEYDNPNRAKMRVKKHVEDLRAILVWFKYNCCHICMISFVTECNEKRKSIEMVFREQKKPVSQRRDPGLAFSLKKKR